MILRWIGLLMVLLVSVRIWRNGISVRVDGVVVAIRILILVRVHRAVDETVLFEPFEAGQVKYNYEGASSCQRKKPLFPFPPRISREISCLVRLSCHKTLVVDFMFG